MNKEKLLRILPHIVAPVIFIVISLAFFSPLLEGKRLAQHDIAMWKGGAKEVLDYKEKTGEVTLWTNSMFGGMPAYLISTTYTNNLLRYVDKALNLITIPASFIFIAMLGFYILMLVMEVNPWLSIVGSIAYGLSAYFIIVIGAGHNAKIRALGYVAPMIAGMLLTFRGKLISGLALFSLFLGLNIYSGHPQITYYAAFIMGALFIAYVIDAYINNTIKSLGKVIAVFAIAGVLAVGANFSNLWFTYDYGKDSIRGKSELTDDQHNKTSGLDKDYATQWSYGPAETFNLLIPNLMGGASSMNMGEKSETFTFLRQNGVPMNQTQAIVSQLPTYWGPQPSTSGPVYIGAIVIFLFVMGLFLIKNTTKWAILAVTALAIFLSWGDHFNFLTDLFLNYFPAYNKFRTVSMILVVVEFTMPFLGFWALKDIYEGKVSSADFMKAFKWSVGIVGGICLLFMLLGGAMFNFTGKIDQQLLSSGWPQELLNAIQKDRQHMLWSDSLRSLIFVLIGAGLVFALFKKKLKPAYFIIALGFFITVDMWVVNKRYIDNRNFVTPTMAAEPFNPSDADRMILADNDPNFRVFNLTVSPFNDASTSYFHKSIGGYHGAKMRRYQDLIEKHLATGNMAVLNMLNTKYLIQQGKNGPVAVENPNALGNVWFVDTIKMVDNADQEIAALNGFNPKTTAIVDKRFESMVKDYSTVVDSTDNIKLDVYKPNKLIYSSSSKHNRIAVFSEIYYAKGWKVTIDGKPANHFRANYVLRAMDIPQGGHKIEFTFDPEMWYVGRNIDLASSLLILLIFVGWIGWSYKKENLL
ncbi:membrane protein [Tenuifilaceae bacterium CYCD]|nr:membrane protein [Tenuifilaceae bacterium CYCD]